MSKMVLFASLQNDSGSTSINISDDNKGSQEGNASLIRRGTSGFTESLASKCVVHVFEIAFLVNQSYF